MCSCVLNAMKNSLFIDLRHFLVLLYCHGGIIPQPRKTKHKCCILRWTNTTHLLHFTRELETDEEMAGAARRNLCTR